ncbi:Sodium:dicarboxylate symporter family-domain-containing protein [Choanephora cucurbitarum]|nr:Sodium:dicarboxylate symporter family-domain-containing protein [Choanephora cucurbitarum]
MDEITSHKDTSANSDHHAPNEKLQAGSFTEDVNAARDDASSFRYRNQSAGRDHIPQHLRIPPVENVGYSPRISNIGKQINDALLFAIAPFIKLIRFLNRRTNLSFWIIVSMVVGILIGYFAPAFGKEIKPLGDAFIMMIKICIVPLVFSVLVIGIAGHGDDIGKVGKLAIKTLIYFEVVTTLALALGLIMANLVKPGQGVTLPVGSDISSVQELADKEKTSITWSGELFMIIPENFFVAAVNNKVLAIVFCAVLFACAMMKADKKSKKFMLQINESLSQVMFQYVALIMRYAPIGIGSALAATVGSNGISVLANLGKLIGCLYASLVIFLIVVLVPIMFLAKIPIIGFFKAIAQPWLLAFSSASSESALPLAFDRMREFGCPNSLTGFVIPCGYSFNLDGTTLYLSLATIFSAQAAGLNLPLATQMSIMGTLMLSSKGVAAIPRASLVVLSGTLAQYNIPLEAVLMIMGVDAIMDMARTSLNVFGNCLGCCVMARVEGSFRGEEWRQEEEDRRYKKWLDEQEKAGLLDRETSDLSGVVVHNETKAH